MSPKLNLTSHNATVLIRPETHSLVRAYKKLSKYKWEIVMHLSSSLVAATAVSGASWQPSERVDISLI